MTITEFLTARFDEEARYADYALMLGETHEHDPDRGDATVTLKWTWGLVANYSSGGKHAQKLVHGAPPPARVIADIAAKRRLVELCATWIAEGERHVGGQDAASITARTQAITAETVLRSLVQPYAEHPDYDQAWRA